MPNNLPSTEQELSLLRGVEDLFEKRLICLDCYDELNHDQPFCSKCLLSRKSSVAQM